MAINRKKIVFDTIAHKETDYLPYVFSWEGEIDKKLDVYFGSSSWRNQFRNYIQICAGAEDGAFTGNTKTGPDLYGSIWQRDKRPLHLLEPVLKKPSLHGYQFPAPDRFFPQDWQDKFKNTINQYQDCFTVAMLGFGIFERCWVLRGFENVLLDIVTESAFVEDLLNAVTEHQLELLEYLLTLPIDGFLYGDDWGDQRGIIMGANKWRELLKSHVFRIFRKIKKSGKVVVHHSCGSVVDIIPDLIEMGLDILESVQPEARGMLPMDLKSKFGKDLTFWGGLGSQSIIPFGRPEDLRCEIRKLAYEMRKNGGYILSCAKSLQPETPVENAVLVFEEFLSFGESQHFDKV